MIVMSYPHVAAQLQTLFGPNVVVVDPANLTSRSAESFNTSKTSTHNRTRKNAKKTLLAWGRWYSAL